MSADASDDVRRAIEVFQKYAEDERFRSRWDPHNRGNRFILSERLRATQSLLRSHNLWPPLNYRVLDVGCGSGDEIARFRAWGAQPVNLVGVDLVEQRVYHARRTHPEICFLCSDGSRLGFRDGVFRLVLLSTVLSSVIAFDGQREIVEDVARVLEPGGYVLWYDFRVSAPRNQDTRGVGIRRLRRLFPGYDMDLRRVTVLPPVSRRLGLLAPAVYPLLARVPPMRTHYIGLLRKPA